MKNQNFNMVYLNFAVSLVFFVPMVLIPKGTIEQQVNLFEYPSLFLFFKTTTLLGDGWILLLAFLSLLAYYFSAKTVKARDEMMTFLFSALFMIVLVSLLKNVFFYSSPRPVKFFNLQSGSSLIDSFDLRFHHFRSFPSGHTATVSLLGFYLMRYFRREFWWRFLFVLILLGGFSRVFLFQHFLADVLAGIGISLISVLVGIKIVELLYYRKTNNHSTYHVTD
jgi:membrane-associated phospholipid phosphatase